MYTYVLRVWGLGEKKTPVKLVGLKLRSKPGMYVCVYKSKRLRLTLAPKNPIPIPFTPKNPHLGS